MPGRFAFALDAILLPTELPLIAPQIVYEKNGSNETENKIIIKCNDNAVRRTFQTHKKHMKQQSGTHVFPNINDQPSMDCGRF